MGDAPFEQISDRELVELIERRSPHHPRRISRLQMRAFLDGRLVLRDEAGLDEDGGVFIKTDLLVQAMIRAGIHLVTNHGEGMKAAAYRHLWPSEVPQPSQYAGRFDQVLLVDTTVELAALIEHGNVEVYKDTASCEDMVPAPTREGGKPATRYIAFFQDGDKNKGRTVECCCASFAEDEVGLVTREGLYLPIQHESIFHNRAVDFPGSRYAGWLAPCVGWFDDDRPGFHVVDIQCRDPHYGSASRGSVVVAVS